MSWNRQKVNRVNSVSRARPRQTDRSASLARQRVAAIATAVVGAFRRAVLW
jgi:hypothetical protein